MSIDVSPVKYSDSDPDSDANIQTTSCEILYHLVGKLTTFPKHGCNEQLPYSLIIYSENPRFVGTYILRQNSRM